MELTREYINMKIDSLLKKLMISAQAKRDQIPHSEKDSFPNILVFLGPNLEPATQPIDWANEDEKYAKMRAVSQVAKEMLCIAVILITDTRWVEEERAASILGIPRVAEVGLAEYKKNYSRALRDRYKGYLGNAPPELYSEALVVVAKGPTCGTRVQFSQYEKGPGDGIRWLKSDYKVANQEFNLLPDWWQ